MNWRPLPKPRTPGSIHRLACEVAVLRDQLEVAGVWPWLTSHSIEPLLPTGLSIWTPYGRMDVYAHPMCGEDTIITIARAQHQTHAHRLESATPAAVEEVLRVETMEGRRSTEALISPRAWATLNSLMCFERSFNDSFVR